MALRQLYIFFRHLHQPLVMLMKSLDFAFSQIFYIDQAVAGAFERRHDLVQFQVNGKRVLILRALDQEDHQKRYDGRARVYYQLTGVLKIEQRAAD
jgi:hypothetical protein